MDTSTYSRYQVSLSDRHYIGQNAAQRSKDSSLTYILSMCTNATTEKLPASAIFNDYDYERTAVNDFYHISYTYLGTIGSVSARWLTVDEVKLLDCSLQSVDTQHMLCLKLTRGNTSKRTFNDADNWVNISCSVK